MGGGLASSWTVAVIFVASSFRFKSFEKILQWRYPKIENLDFFAVCSRVGGRAENRPSTALETAAANFAFAFFGSKGGVYFVCVRKRQDFNSK